MRYALLYVKRSTSRKFAFRRLTVNLMKNKLGLHWRCPKLTKLYHRLRFNAALGVTSHFNGKIQNLTPVYPKLLNFSEPKFAQMITFGIISWCARFGENPFTGGFPTNRWNITLAWLFVLSFSFFLAVLYKKNNWINFNVRWLIWRDFAQGSAFWGLQNLNLTF